MADKDQNNEDVSPTEPEHGEAGEPTSTEDGEPSLADEASESNAEELLESLLSDIERNLVEEYKDRAARAEAELANFRNRVERDRACLGSCADALTAQRARVRSAASDPGRRRQAPPARRRRWRRWR